MAEVGECPNCGMSIFDTDEQPLCPQCRQPLPEAITRALPRLATSLAAGGYQSATQSAAGSGSMVLRSDSPAFTVVGFVIGAVVGFLTRPSVFLIGQLPFSTVISRGGNLSGVDQLLVPAAQASFNQMLFLAILGAAVGFGVPFVLRLVQRTQLAAAGGGAPDGGRPASPQLTQDAEILTNEAVLKMIAAGLGDDVLLEKMKYSRCSFALSSSDLAHLKQSGASDRIVAGMLQNQAQRGRTV